MHELSIAMSLIEAAEAAARQAGAARVTTVFVRIGRLSGVVTDALRFSFDVAAQGTMLESATLDVEDVPVVAHCPSCRRDVELPEISLLQCPACGTSTPDVVRGRDLELLTLEVEDEPAHR